MSTDPVRSAYDLAAAGRPGDGLAMLQASGARGDRLALAELATWYLRGDLVARDLPAARAALRSAVTIGHVDAALLEIALVANGSGGDRDWGAALALLRTAAVGDPVAAKHLALLDAMDLDGDGYPLDLSPGKQLADDPLILRFADAFSPAECQHIAEVAHGFLEPGVVIDPATGQSISHPIRDSHGATIGPAQEDLVIAALNRRLAAMTNTKLENGEPLQVLRYTGGQQYRLHSDALTGVDNQRAVTAIAYLNHGFAGGETDFPDIALSVRPRAGDVLVFHNTLPDGRANARARHAGKPVTAGAKWIATRWIRAAPYDAWRVGER